VNCLNNFRSFHILVLCFVFIAFSCSKGGSGGGTNPPPSDLCPGVTITVSSSVSNNLACQLPAIGTITVTAGSGTGPYTYRLNSGVFQSSNVFSALVAGTYSITVKDANGCTASGTATVSDFPPGPLFTAVRTVLQNNCVPCHNGGLSEGGMNWTIDCNIVAFKDKIKMRAVDGNPSPMPPTGLLPGSEQLKIINWINAGGRFSD
jgi:hypothetical protein